MADIMQIVIVRILRHTPVEVRSRQDVLFKSVRESEDLGFTIASCLFSIVFTAISARK